MSGQIVWFITVPIVLVCPHCEVVAAHCTDKRCWTCGGPWVEFVASAETLAVAEKEREAGEAPDPPRHPRRLMAAFAAGWDAKAASGYDDDSGFDEALDATIGGV